MKTHFLSAVALLGMATLGGCSSSPVANLSPPLSTSLFPSSAQTVDVNQTLPLTAKVSSGAAGVIWSVSSGGGSLTSVTGLSAVYVAPSTAIPDAVVTATSVEDPKQSASVHITVNAPPSFATSTLPNANRGLAYSVSVTTTGGTGKRTVALSTGSLPPGLSLDNTGQLSGTPSATGTYTFTLQVQDSALTPVVSATQFTVNVSTLTISQSVLAGAAVGTPYQAVQLDALNAVGAVSFSVISGNLPAGLVMSGSGLITGMPTAAGTSAFTIKAVDFAGQMASTSFSVVVAPQLSFYSQQNFSSIHVTGDSLVGDNTDGGRCYGSTNRYACWWAMEAKALNIPEAAWTIQGRGGSTFADQAVDIFSHDVVSGAFQLFEHHTAINDCNILGCPDADSNRANGPGMFYSGLLAESVWDLTPRERRMRAVDACQTGWTPDPTYTYGIGVIASANGTSCSTSVYAKNVVIVGYGIRSGNGGTFRVDVDGGEAAGGSSATAISQLAVDNVGNPILPSPFGLNYAPQAVLLPVSSAGMHTVTVTVTSAPEFTFTGNTVAGSNLITNVSSTAGLTGGQPISGLVIPNGSTYSVEVAYPYPPLTVPLSAQATASSIGTTFTASGNSVRLLYFTGDAMPDSAGSPVLQIAGMPANGHKPFCKYDNWPDNESQYYDSTTRNVAALLRLYGYDARWVDERATQVGSETTFQATTSSGSPVVSVSSTDGLQPGDAMFASPGIPDNAVIVSVDSANRQITLNSPATATNTVSSGASHWFFGNADCIHPSDQGYASIAAAHRVTAGELPMAVAGHPIERYQFSAQGGTPGYTYALANDSTLPPGLSLTSSGALSGTPSQPGIYRFSIVATDSGNATLSSPKAPRQTTTAAFMLTVGGQS